MQNLELAYGWQLKRHDTVLDALADAATEQGWIAATVPGNVHQDLIAAGKLPDPFEGLNEHAAQWVGECDWLYRCRFELPANIQPGDPVALRCDGLDTIATLWVNGVQVAANDNMFVPVCVPISQVLQPGTNELLILFESAFNHGRAHEATHGKMPVWNGDGSRVYVRKAQYHYGWDWGPVLLTAGPWRPVVLEIGDTRIAELDCPVTLAPDLSSAEIAVRVTLDSPRADLMVQIDLLDPDGVTITATQKVAVQDGQAQQTLAVQHPQLWWPNGLGAQPRYTLRVAVMQGAAILDSQERRLGLRCLRLVQEPIAGEPGTSFMFEVNNVALFCGGANWIPADSFTPRITPERYRALIKLAADANMQMLRVWGGGIYEDPAFYEACDELGILVWQDFMFACGMYPAHPEFLANVRREAETQVRRLRHHACLALWCGNNEDYQIAESLGRCDLSIQENLAESPFPAREIYERLLPDVCATLDPGRSYWPGSPYGGSWSADPTIGDRHTWDVWHGEVAPYQEYPRFIGRFVSEFGMASLPELATIEQFTPLPERYPGSRTLDHHNKASGGPRRIAAYLTDNLVIPADLEGYIYATQLIQSEALVTAVRTWRRRWGKAGTRACSGALVWQINDCWPVISWAFVDYHLRPKPAYYTLRRELAPVTVGLIRNGDEAEVWAVNATLTDVRAAIELRTWTLGGDQVAMTRLQVTLPPLQVTELGTFGYDPSKTLVIDARLLVGDEIVARTALWPEPLKYQTWPDPVILMDLEDHNQLRLRSARPAKGVLLSAGDGMDWSDNMLDLMPGDERVITAHGLDERPIHIRWLGR